MTNLTSSEWSSEADGPAYNVPEPEDTASIPEDFQDTGVALTEDGEVEFGDEFFDDLKDNPAPEEQSYYTMDELKNVPYEEWDMSRLPESVREYAEVARSQMEQRNLQAQIHQRANSNPFMNEVKPYTPDELAYEAQKKAIEKLGLEDAEDFDEYESSHQAALKLAMDELTQKRNTEVANYQRGAKEYQELQRFNAQLVAQPDYREFDEWFGEQCRTAGVTRQAVDAGLSRLAQSQGNNFGLVQGFLSSLYQEFRGNRGGNGGYGMNMPIQSRGRGQMPPVLESTRGNSYDGSRRVNARTFGELDTDQQAQALMRMGIV